MTTIFNPALFAEPSTESQGDQQQEIESQNRGYPQTGNSTRDQVRKLLFELFSADEGDLQRVSQVVEALESQIIQECSDPKSKQYRDKSRLLQTKLKGSRFTDLRVSLLKGEVSVQDVCNDDFLNGKKQINSSTGPRSGQSNPQPVAQKPVITRGPPGQAVRPRGMAQMIRPPGVKPMIPRPIAQSIQENQIEQENKQESPRIIEDPPVEMVRFESQISQETTTISQPEPSQIVIEADLDTSELSNEDRPGKKKKKKKKVVNMDNMLESIQEQKIEIEQVIEVQQVPESIILPEPQQQELLKPQIVKQQTNLDQVRPQPVKVQSDPPIKVDSISLPVQTPIQSAKEEIKQQASQIEQTKQQAQEQFKYQAPKPVEVKPEKQAKTMLVKPEEQAKNMPIKPEIKLEEKKKDLQKTIESDQQAKQIQNVVQVIQKPLEKQELKIPERLQQKDRVDPRVELLMQENQKLRAQLRNFAQQEQDSVAIQYEFAMLKAQLQLRDEQIIKQQQQMAQIQSMHQQETNELRQRIKRVQQESAQFRDELQHFDRRHEEPKINYYQHAGNEANPGEGPELILESGEAEEGGRDDGHFYRDITHDEGTGGESYHQQPRIDLPTSGSGQMPNVGYQRFETVISNQDHNNQNLIHEDEEEDEDNYDPSQQYYANSEQHMIRTRPQISSSGSAFFGEGMNQQDQSDEEGVGNNRQEDHDDSGTDLIPENSGQQNLFQHRAEMGMMLEQSNQHPDSNEEPQQHVAEQDLEGNGEGNSDENQDQQDINSHGEEGGCRSNGGDHDENFEDDGTFNGRGDDYEEYYEQQEVCIEDESGQDPSRRHQIEEEEKVDQSQISAVQNNLRVVSALGDNVERPQPYHPRQQRSQQFANGVVLSSQQNVQMQGESKQKNSSVGAVGSQSKIQNNSASLLQSGDRPGAHQRRGNKQQFQVPIQQPTVSSKEQRQGQGGGVVINGGTSKVTNQQSRSARGTQRNYSQQQPQNFANIEQSNSPIQRPSASQASSVAQYPKTTGMQQNKILPKNQAYAGSQVHNMQGESDQQMLGNSQGSNLATQMPASQASVSGQLRQTGFNSGYQGASQVPVNQRQEGVVHTASQQMYQGQSSTTTGGGLGSSGSGDVGGLTERRVNLGMNAESGSTAEFTNSQRFFQPYNQMQQVFSSPPSTSHQGNIIRNRVVNFEDPSAGGAESDVPIAAVNAPPKPNRMAAGAISQANPRPKPPLPQVFTDQQSLNNQHYAEDSSQSYFNQSSGLTQTNEPNQINTRGSNLQQIGNQQQAHTDSRKTSGANTPSKDGADTPPYREHTQQNSYILNLTSKRLLLLESQDGVNNSDQHQVSQSSPSNQNQQPNRVIPRNMFE